jgi:hypothetical protein
LDGLDLRVRRNAAYAAVPKLDYPGTVSQGRQTMSNDQDGKVVTQAVDGLHYCLLGFVVQRTGGLVENNDVGLLVKGAGDADTLALAAGKPDTAFADKGLVFSGPSLDGIGYLCLACGPPDTLDVYPVPGLTKGYVLFYGDVRKKDRLGDMCDVCLPCPAIARRDGPAIDLQRAFVCLQQAHHDIKQGALAAAGQADEADAAAFRNGEIKVLQNPWRLRAVAESDLVQADLTLEGQRLVGSQKEGASRRSWQRLYEGLYVFALPT